MFSCTALLILSTFRFGHFIKIERGDAHVTAGLPPFSTKLYRFRYY